MSNIEMGICVDDASRAMMYPPGNFALGCPTAAKVYKRNLMNKIRKIKSPNYLSEVNDILKMAPQIVMIVE